MLPEKKEISCLMRCISMTETKDSVQQFKLIRLKKLHSVLFKGEI